MSINDQHCFNCLKQAIFSTFSKKNGVTNPIANWKGEEIILFQEDLFATTKAKVSEKWFYTYIKNTPEKLPRIDILNLLSAYVGFKTWNTFKTAHQKKVSKKQHLKKRYFLFLIPLIILAVYRLNLSNTFQFCFINEDQGNAITNTVLNIKVLQDNESPLYFKTDSLGCFSVKTNQDRIRFVVSSPYHKTDTITRSFSSSTNKTVKLQTDDYALMLHYYANGNKQDWNKRKEQLNMLIAEKAQIYQVFKQHIGIELYSKQEFISKLTTPTNSLKNIKILDKSYKNEKIVKLKFIVK